MRREYKNGYLGKIEYWSAQLVEAVKLGDYKKLYDAKKSLDYFVDKQKELIYQKSLEVSE